MHEIELNHEVLTKLQSGLKSRLPQLKGKKLLIIGDIGLDEYVMGEVKRISPEAPVPVVEVNSQDERLGLAANVAQNVQSLGGTAELVAVIGQDMAAEKLTHLLKKADVNPEHLISCSDRPTTRKLRIMAEHHHIVRVDFEHRKFLSPEDESRVLKKVSHLLDSVDAVVMEDYAKGVFSQTLCAEVIRLSHEAGKKVVLDPHPKTPVRFYRGVDLLTPNRDEALALSGLVLDDLSGDSLLKVGVEIMKKIGNSQLVITRGKEGMSLFSDNHVTRLPTYARQVFDVTGAGDTVIAAMTLAWASGFNLTDACALANFAAGVVVGKVGCVPCTVPQLMDYIDSFAFTK